jgi:MFS family permease
MSSNGEYVCTIVSNIGWIIFPLKLVLTCWYYLIINSRRQVWLCPLWILFRCIRPSLLSTIQQWAQPNLFLFSLWRCLCHATDRWIITGHIGDRHGRKKALVFSLFCMSIPTVALGLLPTYASVGWWSTALLVICRMLQGFSVGGNLPSSLSTLLRRNRRSTGDFMVPQVRVLDLGVFLFIVVPLLDVNATATTNLSTISMCHGGQLQQRNDLLMVAAVRSSVRHPNLLTWLRTSV